MSEYESRATWGGQGGGGGKKSCWKEIQFKGKTRRGQQGTGRGLTHDRNQSRTEKGKK